MLLEVQVVSQELVATPSQDYKVSKLMRRQTHCDLLFQTPRWQATMNPLQTHVWRTPPRFSVSQNRTWPAAPALQLPFGNCRPTSHAASLQLERTLILAPWPPPRKRKAKRSWGSPPSFRSMSSPLRRRPARPPVMPPSPTPKNKN